MTPLDDLTAHGQSVWIDFLSRNFVRDGDLARLVERGVSGVTSNPTIFQLAVAEGHAYDDQLRGITTDDPKEVFLQLAAHDVRAACDVLRETWDRTEHRDGWVSLEVDPTLAYDAEATLEEAKRLRAIIDRPNLLVKIPATEPGLVAIEEAIAAGVPVNVTLIFSLQRHRAVAEAYLRGLERLGDPSTVASVASFFVSRVDTETDKRLDASGGHGHLRGALAIANAKLAYVTFQELFTGPDWTALEARGATPQRCLWASTGVKDPAYRDTLYVDELIGPDTVNTMPLSTLEAFADHGQAHPRVTEDVDGAREVLADLSAAGIDYTDVVNLLEREGVQKFVDAWTALLEDVASKRAALVTA